MATEVECTHCKIIMTSWSVPGSPVKYYQCPFCSRTFCSAYGEVFRKKAGARLVAMSEPAEAKPTSVPERSSSDIHWAGVKARAARWFARLEREQHPGTNLPIQAVSASPEPTPVVDRLAVAMGARVRRG